jgi:hypothetical protein
MVIKMKSTSIVAGSIGCIALSLTMVNSAEAGNHGSRADLPCPYGPGSGNWAPPTVASNPLNINAGVSGLVPVELVGTLTGPDAAFNQDENGLTIVSAVQYDGYATAPLAASTCTSTTNSPGPLTQVMDYGIQAGSQLSLTNGSTLTLAAGTTEVAFYYDQATTSLTRFQSAPGTASFTIGGVTYSSTGSLVPYNTGNDFFFDASGFGGCLQPIWRQPGCDRHADGLDQQRRRVARSRNGCLVLDCRPVAVDRWPGGDARRSTLDPPSIIDTERRLASRGAALRPRGRKAHHSMREMRDGILQLT